MTQSLIGRNQAKDLPPGSPEHYSAYVGPPRQYDFMGATQFRLACSLGLREAHKLLDFGCGSLRAGRLLIPYLDSGNYYGIEPNSWLLEEAIRHEVGVELVSRKDCQFDQNTDFNATVFGVAFDFIIAQSIFSHAGRKQIDRALASFKTALRPNGLVLATFATTQDPDRDNQGDEWVYPACVHYLPDSIKAFAHRAGLAVMQIPWYHPRQLWFIMAHTAGDLPSADDAARHLTGVVLRAPELRDRR